MVVAACRKPGVSIASLARQIDPTRDYSLLALGSLAAPQLVALADDNSLPDAAVIRVVLPASMSVRQPA